MNPNHWTVGLSKAAQCAAAVYLAVSAMLLAHGQCLQTTDVSGSINYIATPPYNSSLIYDSARGLTLALTETNGVFTYDGLTWTYGADGGLPSGVSGQTAGWVYDSVRQVALRYGGSLLGSPGTSGSLYAWKPSGWWQLNWTGPSPPAGEGMGVFDPIRGRAIFLLDRSGISWETWEWTGSAWEQGPTLSGSKADSFVFVTKHNIAFLSGVDPSNGHEAVWFYTPGATAAQSAWTQATISRLLPAKIGTALAYDPYRDRVMRCFGHDPTSTGGYIPAIYAWDWNNSRWSSFSELFGTFMPGVGEERAGAGAAYDLNRDKLVMYGGLVFHVNTQTGGYQFDYHDDTWEQTDNSPGFVASSSGPFADCAGSSTVFSVTPVNGSVQWYHNAVAINGATFPLLVLNNLGAADAGNYGARVQNDCGYIDTPMSHLRVDPPITIFRPSIFPDCSLLCPGKDLTIFPPAPVNTGIPLTLHLQKYIGAGNWVDVRVSSPSFPTNFIFNNVQTSFSGDYRFYIDGSTCPGLIENAPWHIQVGFDIVSQPQNLVNIRPCDTVTFSVATDGGCGLVYQWYKNQSQTLTNDGHFSGTQTPTLTISGVHYDDEAFYNCIVIDTNQCNNTVVSSLASLKLALPQWVLRTTTGPSPRYGNAMAYDSARGVTVMYSGGYVDPTYGYTGFGDLWEWDGTRWRQRTTYSWTNAWHQDSNGYWGQNYGDTPAARLQHAMAYDSRRGRVVMFGGRGSNGRVYGDYQFNDTWEWDGTRWYFRTTNGPPATFDHHMAYDPSRGVTVLYGGFANSSAKVWEWDGSNWTSLSPTNGPVTTYYQDDAALDYDWFLGAIFAGPTTDGFTLNYYWSWDGHNWSPHQQGFGPFTTTPTLGAMVYDTYRYRSFHYGGQDNANFTSGSTAAYYDSASNTWTNGQDEVESSVFVSTDFLNVTNLALQLIAQADPVSQYVWNQFSNNIQQTLTNSGASADQKKIALANALNTIISNNVVYDANRFATVPLSSETAVFKAINPQGRDLVRFNRLLLEDAYSGEIVPSLSTPPGRTRFAMAFDSARRTVVVMGGYYGGTGLNPLNGSDTWELMYLDVPVINNQPASQYRAPGDTAVFRVNANGPSGSTLNYDWYFGSVLLTDGGRISGAHSATLRVANVTATDAGQYQARASDGCGSIFTAPAILTTNPGLQIFSANSGSAQLIWSAATLVLEQADVATGPWSIVPGASSPFDLTLNGPGKFYRLATNSPAGP